MEIRFTYETKYGAFSDALILPDDHTFTESELTSMKEQTLRNFIKQWIYSCLHLAVLIMIRKQCFLEMFIFNL